MGENGNSSKVLGLRKFISTVGYGIIALGLAFSALLLDKVDGSEFLQALLYVGSVVTAYNGLSVVKAIKEKRDDS